MSDERIAIRTCPLCEATCGLEITIRDGSVFRIRGDRDDVFSAGFICPKGTTLGRLHDDPDRLREPVVRTGDTWRTATWDEAFDRIAEGLRPIIEQHGGDSVAVYLGNPIVHQMDGLLYGRILLKTLGTRNIYTAATVDQMPKHVSSGFLFGHPDTIPVPDLDRTAYLLMLGANPLESNGSLATAPDFPGRLEAIRERGGKVVVVDPRRTKTAEVADEHVPIRPGTDPLFLFALVNVLMDEGLASPGRLGDFTDGIGDVAAAATTFTPERVAGATGIDAGTIRRIARDLANAPSAAVYGRIGTHTAPFGTLAAWLVDVLNVLTGNLDRPGGAMFSRSAHEQSRGRRPFTTGRWTSRVRSLPEVRGELPVATLADEIETPGDGQVRALITLAGNPVLSTPNGRRLDRALESLEFMVAVDIYRNATTRHADVILPGPSTLERPHYDLAFTQLSVRNVANYSPAVFPANGDRPQEWEIILRLAAAAGGTGADVATMDDMVVATLLGRAVADPASPVHGRDPEELATMSDAARGPERLLDVLLRTGPYGDGYGADPDGLTLARLREHPHGLDLGALEPRLPGLLATESGSVELAPEPIMDDVPRLEGFLEEALSGGDRLLMVGRRTLRSNNSWMHNIETLVKGKERCTLQIHPDDAAHRDIADGDTITLTTSVGAIEVPAEVTDVVMPGVVSLPHGWGHDRPGVDLSVAGRRPGASMNDLTDETMLDPLSGDAVLTALPVEVARSAVASPAAAR